MTDEDLEGPKKTSGQRALVSWARVAREHPWLVTALAACMVAGSLLAWHFLPHEISAPRRILGGALLGFLSYLVVMMGRMLD